MSDIAKRLQQIEDKINQAKIEQSICEKQLKELRPKRDALEQKCADTYGCKVSELPEKLVVMETELVNFIEQLEDRIAKAESS